MVAFIVKHKRRKFGKLETVRSQLYNYEADAIDCAEKWAGNLVKAGKTVSHEYETFRVWDRGSVAETVAVYRQIF